MWERPNRPARPVGPFYYWQFCLPGKVEIARWKVSVWVFAFSQLFALYAMHFHRLGAPIPRIQADIHCHTCTAGYTLKGQLTLF